MEQFDYPGNPFCSIDLKITRQADLTMLKYSVRVTDPAYELMPFEVRMHFQPTDNQGAGYWVSTQVTNFVKDNSAMGSLISGGEIPIAWGKYWITARLSGQIRTLSNGEVLRIGKEAEA